MPDSSGEVGVPGIHGGLHTTRSARPGGKRSRRSTVERSAYPMRCRFSRAQVTARGSTSVATTTGTPRCSRTAASTPVPVPTSNATRAGASGARATRST
ncbi:hypothetical protein BJF90_34520 [Pseudonocardia sp. CNS-004]|nr:hypothetical protein BJF90_34520 [Pseudonocardia sp. CNS-004]